MPQCLPSLSISTWHAAGGIHPNKDVLGRGYAPLCGNICVDVSIEQHWSTNPLLQCIAAIIIFQRALLPTDCIVCLIVAYVWCDTVATLKLALIHFPPGPFAKLLLQTEANLVGSTLLSLWKEVDSGSKSCWSRWNDAYSQGPFSPHWWTLPAEQLRGRIHLMIEALRPQNLEGTTVLRFYHNICACLVAGYLLNINLIVKITWL